MYKSRQVWFISQCRFRNWKKKLLYFIQTNHVRQLGTSHHDRPFRIAVIGSGPSGFYASQKVLSKIENSFVDMYERLPVPYGLVRYGVAPDHPEVKLKS